MINELKLDVGKITKRKAVSINFSHGLLSFGFLDPQRWGTNRLSQRISEG
jgi:hypothetical protein